jgi:hypothetical protein
MMCYLLLRKNAETGPYTLDELTAQALKPTDLIWIEGQSTAWKYPTEIEALQAFIEDGEPVDDSGFSQGEVISTSKGIFVALPPHFQPKTTPPPTESEEAAALHLRFSQPLETLQEQYQQLYEQPGKVSRIQFSKTFSKPHNTIWLGSVFAGLLLSAGLIKKMVDAYEENATGLATAAAMPINNMDNAMNEPDANQIENALTTEVVPIDTFTMRPVKKELKKVDLKKMVSLEANDYQVGLLGGIKNLRMLVINNSALILDKVKFELQYLKPNGDVVKTEHMTLNSVAPKSRKSMAIPSNKRGVKVTYHITSIQSKQNSDELLNL